MELRNEFRYALSLKALFLWSDENGALQTAEGITRDLSTKGAFVYSPISPPQYSRVRMGLDLALPGGTDARLHISVKGRIVRIERYLDDPVHSGFAVLSESTILGQSRNFFSRPEIRGASGAKV